MISEKQQTLRTKKNLSVVGVRTGNAERYQLFGLLFAELAKSKRTRVVATAPDP
jgi:hypothetical protein